MNIVVLSGSPKGKDSVTLRYVEFLQLHHPQHEFKVLHIGQKILKLEKNEAFFAATIEEIEKADALLWVTPVYYLLVPAQLKRFIELTFERNCTQAFTGKPAAAITTSIHFFDHTALRYLHAISEDLGMLWLGAYPAEMNDLVRSRERERFRKFGQAIIEAFTERELPLGRVYPQAGKPELDYRPAGSPQALATGGKKITLIADLEDRYINLSEMIGYLKDCFTGSLEFVNLAETAIKAGCRGCLACGADNSCFYETRDDFYRLFEDKVVSADIIIFASVIRDRFLSSRIKIFMDRSFYMNHVPYLKQKQIGFLISGSLRQNANLREVLESYTAMHQGNLVGIVTDEAKTAVEVDSAIFTMARQALMRSAEDYLAPQTFLSVGGRKIFRDFIAGTAQITFPADYKYYRRNHFFDYPQRKKVTQAVVFFLRNLLKIVGLRRLFTTRIVKGLVQPLDKVLSREKEKLQTNHMNLF